MEKKNAKIPGITTSGSQTIYNGGVYIIYGQVN